MENMREPSSVLRMRTACTEKRVIPGDMLGALVGGMFASADVDLPTLLLSPSTCKMPDATKASIGARSAESIPGPAWIWSHGVACARASSVPANRRRVQKKPLYASPPLYLRAPLPCPFPSPSIFCSILPRASVNVQLRSLSPLPATLRNLQ